MMNLGATPPEGAGGRCTWHLCACFSGASFSNRATVKTTGALLFFGHPSTLFGLNHNQIPWNDLLSSVSF